MFTPAIKNCIEQDSRATLADPIPLLEGNICKKRAFHRVPNAPIMPVWCRD